MYSKKVLDLFFNPKFFGKMKNPDAVGKAGNPVCVSPDTLVCGNAEVKEIKNLEVGTKVLGHEGKFHSIEKIFQRPYKGRVYLITTHNLGKSLLTPEHLVLALKLSHLYSKSFRYKLYKNYKAGWYHASELEKGDVILYPIISENKEKKYIDFNIEIPKWDFKSKTLPDRVKIDKNFLKLIGYYLSEGYVRVDKCKGTLGFTFGSHEKNYIDEVVSLVKRIFGIDSARLTTAHNATQIVFYSARLARFFEKNFGKGAVIKHLPHWAMVLPPQKQKHIICGLWRGDGYLNIELLKGKFVTISRSLAYQLRDLLLRQRILFSFLVNAAQGIHKKHFSIFLRKEDSIIKLAKIIGLKVNDNIKIKKEKYFSWFENNFYYASIAKIEPINYNGPVYNLEVNKSHSFTSNSLVLHNCGDILNFYLKIKNGKIIDISYETLGCSMAIAVSEMICQMVKGKTLGEASKLTHKDILKKLGKVPPIKIHCSHLGIDALRKAIDSYRK